MQAISVFEMLKIGVGPSSSHTMGPWRAAQRFLSQSRSDGIFETIETIHVDLYGSLAKTGRGHGTDIAVLMGLQNADPVTCDTEPIPHILSHTSQSQTLYLNSHKPIYFDPAQHIRFNFQETLPYHPNALRLTALTPDHAPYSHTYYSIGGGFVVEEGDDSQANASDVPFPCDTAQDVARHCQQNGLSISQMVLENELTWRTSTAIETGLLGIWQAMLECIYRGCHAVGMLPGGLNVVRRAGQFHRKLLLDGDYATPLEWADCIKSRKHTFPEMIRWVSCFALAVNEENAAFGRVVTAPTNGAAGVLPAVLMYYYCNYDVSEDDLIRFLLVAGVMGSLFKKGATISAALGGCQAEIGVSSAMAAAALTECLGGSVEQVLMAAEIAMEHHLGLTCDPIGGLVQIPCIERNAMGAMKAITAANIALESIPQLAKVSLDAVIKTMWATAQDMHTKYKETAEGGLAVQIPVNVIEC